MALVVLHTIMGLHMSRVSGSDVKHGATLLTLVEHFTCVDAFMSRQGTSHSERLPAKVTHVRPESTVCPAVCRQMTTQRKRLATVATAEWPLPRVFSLVLHHTPLIVRGVFAPLTLMPAVPADVAVTPLHVPVQTMLSQTCVVAVGAVEHAFTWGAQEYAIDRDFWDGHTSRFLS